MKIIKALAVLLLTFACLSLEGQNLIGYKEKDIRTYMKTNMKSMSFSSMTFNSTFKYLKYTDRNEMQTLLFFLTADSVCKSVRLVCDKSIMTQKIKELDAQYKKAGTNKWTESRSGKDYLIELKDEEYSFNVTITQND